MSADPIQLEQRGPDVWLPLRVQPKARRNAVLGVHDGRLKVAVTAAPERGKANAAVIELLAEVLGVARTKTTIVSGETSQKKTVAIAGESVQNIGARLKAWLG